MVAVIPVQGATLPAGADEVVAEAGGSAIVIGDGAADAAAALRCGRHVEAWEAGTFAPGRWAATLAPALHDRLVVVLPASPDGRDLAPRLAAAMRRPLVTGAVRVDLSGAVAATHGGLVHERYVARGPFVATLAPGSRGVAAADVPADHHVVGAAFDAPAPAAAVPDAEVLAVSPPDPAAMDLAEAPRILAGGAGLGGSEEFALLARVADALGASVGGTRVVTDGGLLPHSRQIGTTGVTVRPRLYMAFGISGAVQHTGGLHEPGHVVSVNVDASCPMMAMADLAIVADAPAVLRALADLVGTPPHGAGTGDPAHGKGTGDPGSAGTGDPARGTSTGERPRGSGPTGSPSPEPAGGRDR